MIESILNALFAFAMAFPSPVYGADHPETEDERRERIEMIVEVDAEVATIAAAYGSGYCTQTKASSRVRARTFRRIRAAMTK